MDGVGQSKLGNVVKYTSSQPCRTSSWGRRWCRPGNLSNDGHLGSCCNVIIVTRQILHGDITVQPGLLTAADALGHSGLGDCEALITTVTPLSLSLSD